MKNVQKSRESTGSQSTTKIINPKEKPGRRAHSRARKVQEETARSVRGRSI